MVPLVAPSLTGSVQITSKRRLTRHKKAGRREPTGGRLHRSTIEEYTAQRAYAKGRLSELHAVVIPSPFRRPHGFLGLCRGSQKAE